MKHESQPLAIHNPEAHQLAPVSQPLTVAEIVAHAKLIKEVSESVMQEGTHYGTIPGTPKPTLYQPGAQKLQVTFKLANAIDYSISHLEGGHREVTARATITTQSGIFLGHGVGSCSTLETKYRFINDKDVGEVTPHTVPSSYWRLKDKDAKQRLLQTIIDRKDVRLGTKKVKREGGEGLEWRIIILPDGESHKIENPNIADTYNTVLKMAKKRAFVDGILSVTGASDIFTQDLEDLEETLEGLQPETETGEHSEPANAGRASASSDKPAATSAAASGSTRARGSNAQQKPNPAAAPEEEPEETPRGGQGELLPREEKPTLKGWRDIVVHPKSSVQGKKLGELTLPFLRAIKERWVDVYDWERASDADKRLKAGVLMGIAELSGGTPAPVDPEPKPAPEKSPDVGTKSDSSGPPDFPAEKIAALEKLCEDNAITVETFFEYLYKQRNVPHELAIAKPPIKSFDDDRLPEVMLGEMIDAFPMMMKAWGFKNEPPAEKPKAKRQPRKATRK